MKRLLPVFLAFFLIAPAGAHAAPASHSPAATLDAGTQLARIGGFGRSRGVGGYRPRSRGYPYRGRNRGRGIFRSIIRALAIGYLLHLLFTTPGGLVVLMLMILGVVLLMSRFRRRRVLRY